MASTLDKHHLATQQRDLDQRSVAAVVEVDDLESARSDPRVHAFIAEADSYLAELEQQGRNR